MAAAPTDLLASDNAARRDADVWICFALVALVAAVFGQTLTHDFVGYDDPVYVTDNPFVQRGLSWDGLRWAFTRSGESGGIYAPLTFLTHMLDVELFGQWAGGHHLSSVILHAANAVLLYLALLALTGRRWPGAAVAALFAVHPLRVESVAWISERKDVLSGLFFMLCLIAYARYTRRPTVTRYLAVFLWLALGLMSKSMLVTVPALLLLLDYWPLKRPLGWGRLVLEKLPLLGLSLAAAGVTVATQRQGGFVRSLGQFPLSFRVANAIVSYGRYLGKTIWPFDLAVYYPPPSHWPVGILAVAALVLVLLSVVAVITIRRAPYVAVGWFWFLGTLVPVIGLVQVGRQAMADRYSYLPQIGVFIAVVWSAAVLAERSRHVKNAVAWTAAAVLLALTVRAADQTQCWANTDTLFDHARAVTPENEVALNQTGNKLAREQRLAQAEAAYRRALELDPDYGLAHLNLGNLLARRREFAGAAEQFEAALRWRADLLRAWLGLAVARTGLKQYDAADQAFAQAVRRSPLLAEAQQAWGSSLKERGRRDLAAQHFRAALTINPQLPVARRELSEIEAVPFVAAPVSRPSTGPGSPSSPSTAPVRP